MNPEFRRQLWLGLSATRMAILPALLLACFVAAFLTGADRTTSLQAIAITGAGLFVVLVWGAGTLAAGASVTDEINDRTWDQQRMSAMQPWAMTWGKLAGASAFGWYGGALCLLIALPAALMSGQGGWVLQASVSAILFGVLLQALLIAVNLQIVQNGGFKTRRGGVWVLVAVMFWTVGPLLGIQRELSVSWWGQTFNNVNFALLSMGLFATCALVAAWRSMAQVLAVRQWPWGWPALALLATVYLTGFAPNHKLVAFCAIGMVVCSLLTYFALLTEPQRRPLWSQVITRLSAGQWRAAWLQLPRWPTTLALAVPFALLGSATLSQPDAATWLPAQQMLLHPVAFLLLMLRDCALALFFAFDAKNRRAVAAFLLLMAVLYGLLPWLVGAAGGGFLLGMVNPLLAKSAMSIVFAAIHAAVALGLLRWRWQMTAT
jgi:hypothetical protein